MEKLTCEKLLVEAKLFCLQESTFKNKDLYGVTDGKAVGTYVEHKFQALLASKYDVNVGSSAKGVDLPDPDINTDIKVTSMKQPQSSCPFKSPSEKIYGLGYNLLVFVYDKQDDAATETSTLTFVDCAFIDKNRTGDYQMTRGLRQIIEQEGNIDDIIAYFYDKNLPADEAIYRAIAEDIIKNPPEQGYLTISNALQWRLQYARIVSTPYNTVEGIVKLI